jgi:uncharacterized protein YcbK (DUF882 family)
MKPTATESFGAWFARQKFRHFKADEISWMFSRVNRGARNSEPPRELWPNIVPTLRVLDDLRLCMDKPITLTSTFRNLAYNRSVGSPDGSRHRRFDAIDFKVSGARPAEAFEVLRKWRDAGKFTGGLGLYRSFVHIDTRPTNATW